MKSMNKKIKPINQILIQTMIKVIPLTIKILGAN